MKFEISLGSGVAFNGGEVEASISQNLSQLYSNTFKNKMIEFVEERSRPYEPKLSRKRHQKIGVLFCGRQSPAGINVIVGLWEFCKKNNSTLFGFRNGTKGLFEGNYLEIDDKVLPHLVRHCNQTKQNYWLFLSHSIYFNE